MNFARLRHRLSTVYSKQTRCGLREFQPTSALRTFCRAVSWVKGGTKLIWGWLAIPFLLVLCRRVLRFGLLRQNREAEDLQILAKLCDRLKADAVNPGGPRLFQIYVPVVNEQRFGRLDPQFVDAMLVDC